LPLHIFFCNNKNTANLAEANFKNIICKVFKQFCGRKKRYSNFKNGAKEEVIKNIFKCERKSYFDAKFSAFD